MVCTKMFKRIGIYPGTFDPITAGHMDIILRSIKLVDKLYVAIAKDNNKNTLFSLSEREKMIKDELKSNSVSMDFVVVESFSGLLVNYAKERNATINIRGIRAIADCEYEFQMSYINSMLDSELQTVFLTASNGLQLVSSKFVKEVIKLGGDVGDFISPNVKEKLKAKLR